jgi:4-carboxymuconolactone decarboxylase
MLPEDINPVSRCRVPLPRREDMDEAAAAVFDNYVDPNGGTIRGLHGPGGIRMHSPKFSEISRPANKYLRFQSGFTPRQREVAILITARECNSQFEWAAHEKEGRSCGVPEATIEAIKFRRPLDGLPEDDAVIIQLGRETFGLNKVSPATYKRAIDAFGARKLVDLVSLMGSYAATAALLCVFDMQLDEGETLLLPPDAPSK